MNPHFIGELDLNPLKDGRNWRLTHAFGFWTPDTALITVPKWFVTDLASIPQLFWNILPPFGKYSQAAVVHDYLYRTHITTRRVADWTLLCGMRVCRVPRWQRVTIYCAVRLFGWLCWHDDGRRISAINPHHPAFGPKSDYRDT